MCNEACHSLEPCRAVTGMPPRDATEGLRAAARFARDTPGTTLIFPPGEYRLRDKAAMALEQDVMQGHFGRHPEPNMFRPYFPYVKGLDFTGARDLCIEADGATLLSDGWMEPISLIGASACTLRGLTLDALRPPFSEASVSDQTAESITLSLPPDTRMTPASPLTRVLFQDPATGRLAGTECYPGPVEAFDGRSVRFAADVAQDVVGMRASATHTFHFRPAILIQQSDTISLENITIHAQPGMGLVAHQSRDLTFNGLCVAPAPGGPMMSTNTDATHIASCRGNLIYESCEFSGQGDDSLNVHNYYFSLCEAHRRTCTVRVMAPTHTHAQILDHPQPGDALQLVRRSNLEPLDTYTVIRVRNDPTQWCSHLELDAELPDDTEHCYLQNRDSTPFTRIRHCRFSHHRARGCLIKARRALIEHCRFEGLTGTAIHVGPESFWHEGIASDDIIIRHNTIRHCGSASRQSDSDGIAVNVGADRPSPTAIHGRIRVCDNDIDVQHGAHGIALHSIAELRISKNRITGTDTPIHRIQVTDI